MYGSKRLPFVAFASAFATNGKLLANISCKEVCCSVEMIYTWLDFDWFYAPDMGGHFWAFVFFVSERVVVVPIEPRKGGAIEIFCDICPNLKEKSMERV